MKRKILSSLLAVLLPLVANAESVTEQQALRQAQQFMQGKTFSIAKSRRLATPRQGGRSAAIYVFNADEGGYAVVSGDDRTTPILGYSEYGRLDMNDLPDHILSWLDSYAEQIAYLQEHPEAQLARKTVSGTAVSPLLGTTEWGQNTPFNDLCPIVNGQCCLTGCVATAMAQVMYYHKWPTKTTKEIPSYTTRTLKLTVNAIPVGTIDWNNMLPKYSQFSSDPQTQKQAVASLMQKCGAAVQMDYDVEGSGAYGKDVGPALKDYFDYDAATTYIVRSNYGLQRWNQRIYNELAEGRPVVYGGQSQTKKGHAFVIDGYDKDDYFHVNWGWNGDSNAYFLLSVLDPDDISEENGFSQDQYAVVGIQKNTGQTPEDNQDGESFTAKTVEGIEMTFTIISTKEKTCQVGTGKDSSPAITKETTGIVTIPSLVNGFEVISVGNGSFYGCSKINSVVIPPSIETIGYYAFKKCDGLESISIPASVTSINNYAFGDNANLKRYIVDNDNPSYMSRNGILYNKKGTQLRCYPSGLTGEFSIPADVTSVNDGAFSGCRLTKLVFPETVTSVGGWVASNSPNLTTLIWRASKAELPNCAFQNNKSLQNIELCEGLTNIPIECFEYSSITSIVLPSTIKQMNTYAFRGCSKLESISFSTNVSTFKKEIFYGCKNVKDIVIYYKSRNIFKETLPEETFPENVYQDATLHVPTGSGDFFRTTDGWKKFVNVVEDGAPMPEEQIAEGDIWGYYAGDEIENVIVFGVGGPDTYAAIFIPGDDTMLGAQITAIRIPVSSSKYISNMEQGTAWLAESLNSGLKVREVGMHDLNEWEFKEFVLSEPYIITEKGVYVGFSCPDLVPIGSYHEKAYPGGAYLTLDGEWYSYSNSYRFVIQVRLKGHHLPNVSAYFTPTENNVTYPNTETASPFIIHNEGLEAITNIDYTLNIDGKQETRHIDLSVDAGISMSKSIDITITGPDTPNKIYNVSLTIDKVNGKTNTSPNKTITQQFQNLGRQVVRRTVMEEGTGTWCNFCPRGMAAMKHAKDLYGDRFIGIAIHSSYSSSSGIDPMDIDSYPISFGSIPSCKIDRASETFDPYNDTFSPEAQVNILEAAMCVATDVDVTVKGVWNADKTQVIATSEAEFLAGGEGYSVAYVLVADGVKHEGTAWNQTNGFSGNSKYSVDPYMVPYVEAPYKMTNVTYNDVMIGSSYNRSNNLADAYTGGFAVGEKKTNSYTLTLPTSGELAEAIDKDQVYVVAIVTNADGTIANAAKAKVTTQTAMKGDLNGDHKVSITDVVLIIDVIAGLITDADKVSAADVNGDGKVSITDCVAAIDLIAAQLPSGARITPNDKYSLPNMLSSHPTSDFLTGSMQDDMLAVSLDNENRYTAFQMVVSMPEAMILGKATMDEMRGTDHRVSVHNLGNGQYLVTGFSMDNDELAGKNGRLFTIATEGKATGDIIISEVEFATVGAETYHLEGLTISGTATSVQNVTTESQQIGQSYDLQGRRVKSSPRKKGLYIQNREKVYINK